MKLTVSTLFTAYPVLVAIINEKRKMSVKGSYRLARMYSKLEPEFKIVNDQREALIKEFGSEAKDEDGKPTGGYEVKRDSDKWADFESAVNKLLADEIEVSVEPIPLEHLDNLVAHEFLALGDLVVE